VFAPFVYLCNCAQPGSPWARTTAEINLHGSEGSPVFVTTWLACGVLHALRDHVDARFPDLMGDVSPTALALHSVQTGNAGNCTKAVQMMRRPGFQRSVSGARRRMSREDEPT